MLAQSRIKVNFRILDKESFKKLYYDLRYPIYSLILDALRKVNPKLAEGIHEGRVKRAFLF